MRYHWLLVLMVIPLIVSACTTATPTPPPTLPAPTPQPPTQPALTPSPAPAPTPLPAPAPTPSLPPTPTPALTPKPVPKPLPTPKPPSSPTPIPTQTRPLPPLDAFMKGFNFADWNQSDVPRPPRYGPLYNPLQADGSLKNLAATGTNWISLVVQGGQETVASTRIIRYQYRTATDEALRHVIDLAHSLGMRVLLMPTITLSALPNDSTHWWGEIGTAFTNEAQWQEWFASYREFINHYATFSQEAGVDMLSIGDELGGTTHRESDWRRIIQEVRQRFKGPLTYASLSATGPFPHGEDARIKWWDAVDYIGMQPYYSLTDKNDPTVAELKAAWTEKGYLTLMENLSKRFNKPVIAIEFGYESKDGANRWPASYRREAPVDVQEQADCYQAALEVFWGKPWLTGIFWWQWFANPLIWPGGPNDKGFTPYGKPAEEVLKRYYLQQK